MSIYKSGFAQRPIARNTDPASSHAAAAHMKDSGKLDGQMQEVYELVHKHPNHTALELTEHSKLDRYQISRRLSDLSAAGKVRANRTPRKCGVGGRMSCTWDVVA